MFRILPITDPWDELKLRYGGLINHFWSIARAGCDTEPGHDWSIFTNLREGDGFIEIDYVIIGGLTETDAKNIADQHNATVISALGTEPLPEIEHRQRT